MPNFINNLHERSEQLKGKRLVTVLVAVVIVFILVGIFVGYITNKMLSNNENQGVVIPDDLPVVESEQYEGKVVYVDPVFYPNDDVSFVLEDSEGEIIVLLKSDDEKLTVVEGLNVIVFGELEKTRDGQEDILNVEKVVVHRR